MLLYKENVIVGDQINLKQPNSSKMKLSSLFLSLVACEEQCYTDVGCFTDEFPWAITGVRPARMPQSPDEISTEFRLYTQTTESYQLLDYLNSETLRQSSFSPMSETVFLVHGWQSTSEGWARDGVEALLTHQQAAPSRMINAISVDWRNGAQMLDYPQSAANTQLVGRQIARLTEELIKFNLLENGASVYIAGHSLGGQVAGYAGKYFQKLTNSKIGRISGLDPAGPMFELPTWVLPEERHQVHLWNDDAEFVDIIHTTAGALLDDTSLGMASIVGHADFFPNGGKKNQPGCHQVACHHGRAHNYWVASIKRNCFQAFSCDSYDSFQKGCDKSIPNSNRMGYYATKPVINRSYYLDTTRFEPYC